MSDNESEQVEREGVMDLKTGKLTWKNKLKEKAKDHMGSLAVGLIALILIAVSLYYFFRTDSDMTMGGGLLVGGLVVGGLAYYMYTQENKKGYEVVAGGKAAKKAKKAKKTGKK